jgi:ATP-dependent DNA helicase RecQ
MDGLYLKGFNPQALMISEEVREKDSTFKAKSKQAEEAIQKYDTEKLNILHEKFLTESGGTLAELSEEEAEEVQEKTASHVTTKDLLNEGKTVKEIAEFRSLSIDTILGHIEKLREYKEDITLDHTLPKQKEFDKIAKTFEKLDTRKLTPVYDALGGKTSYQDIRLVRVYLNL